MSTEDILLASFQQETTTLNNQLTERSDFEECMEWEGEEILEQHTDTETYDGGVIDAARRHGVHVIPSISTRAPTGGRVSKEAYQHYTNQIVSDVEANVEDLDAIVLTLHGAMVPEDMKDGEGPLIKRVRDVVGTDIPIAVSLDLHALTTDLMIEAADVLVTVENYPHDDMRVTGDRAATLAIRSAREEIDPKMTIERVPLLPQIPKMLTYRGPMSEVEAKARELEEKEGVVKINVNPTHQHADVPQTSFAFHAVTDGDPELSQQVCEELGQMAWEMRQEFVGEYPDAKAGVKEGIELARNPTNDVPSPALLVDVGDNVGGGGSGDGTVVLRELLEQGVDRAVFGSVWDPESVSECIDAGVGERTTLTALGGKTDDINGEPLEDFEVYVKAITDGRFKNTGTFRGGALNTLGRTALIRCGDDDAISVLLTERRHSPNDAEIWRHVGIHPEQEPLLAIKSVNHYRADYEGFVDPDRIITMDTPGLFPIDLTDIGFESLHRPIFPLDDTGETYESWSA